MIERIKSLGQVFDIYTGTDRLSVWEGEPDTMPEQIYKFSTGDDLDWESLEQFWVEFALHPNELNPYKLLEALVSHVMHNQASSWALTSEQKLNLIKILSSNYRR